MEKKVNRLTWALALPKSDLLVSTGQLKVVKNVSSFFIDVQEEIQLSEIQPTLLIIVRYIIIVCVRIHPSIHPSTRFHCPFPLSSEKFLQLPLDLNKYFIFAKVFKQKCMLWSVTKADICSTGVCR